jgi:N-acetylglucosamine kinase-like BadF-type ATPase
LLAEKGDETARKILIHAGAELTCLADAVLARLFPSTEDVAVAATGGVFRNSDVVFESFTDDLRKHYPGAKVMLSEADPALGALMLARRPR